MFSSRGDDCIDVDGGIASQRSTNTVVAFALRVTRKTLCDVISVRWNATVRDIEHDLDNHDGGSELNNPQTLNTN